VERRTGKLRGHIVVEFQCGDNCIMQQYSCTAPNNTYYYVEKTSEGRWYPAGSRLLSRAFSPGAKLVDAAVTLADPLPPIALSVIRWRMKGCRASTSWSHQRAAPAPMPWR